MRHLDVVADNPTCCRSCPWVHVLGDGRSYCTGVRDRGRSINLFLGWIKMPASTPLLPHVLCPRQCHNDAVERLS